MNEVKPLCPLLGIAAGAAGGSIYIPCLGERCAWFDTAALMCAIQTKEKE